MSQIVGSFELYFQAVRNLYMDTATLLWNGNAISNKDAILKFLEDLPTSEHTLTTLDSQPLVGMLTTEFSSQQMFTKVLKDYS